MGFSRVAGVPSGSVDLARPDDQVQLVDEKDDAAVGLLHLVEHGLKAFLELSAIFRTGHESPHVQGEDRRVLQALGHIAPEDPLGQPLNDCRLADTRLADQDGIVLGLPRQDADSAE